MPQPGTIGIYSSTPPSPASHHYRDRQPRFALMSPSLRGKGHMATDNARVHRMRTCNLTKPSLMLWRTGWPCDSSTWRRDRRQWRTGPEMIREQKCVRVATVTMALTADRPLSGLGLPECESEQSEFRPHHVHGGQHAADAVRSQVRVLIEPTPTFLVRCALLTVPSLSGRVAVWWATRWAVTAPAASG